jgi:hypothetical protein
MNLSHYAYPMAVLLFLGTTARADVESGPVVGEAVPPLKVLAATGAAAGKEVDFAKERKEKPTLYFFVHAEWFDRPTARFLKAVAEGSVKIADEAHVVGVWLTTDKEATMDHLPRIHQALMLQNVTFAVAGDPDNAPDGWGINSDAHVTVAVAHRGDVAATFGYRSVNETVAEKVEKALKEAVDEERKQDSQCSSQ